MDNLMVGQEIDVDLQGKEFPCVVMSFDRQIGPFDSNWKLDVELEPAHMQTYINGQNPPF